MKKFYFLLLTFLSTSTYADNYIIRLDNKQYKDNIVEQKNSNNNIKKQSPYTEASLIETDWKISGDKLATLDTRTGLEWLDLSYTDNLSYNNVKELLKNDLSGWRFPTSEEVYQLHDGHFSSLNIDSSSVPISSSYYKKGLLPVDKTFEMIDKFGRTYTENGGNELTGGYYKRSGQLFVSGVQYFQNSTYFYMNVTLSDFNDNYPNSHRGVYLVSDGGTTLSSKQNPSINLPYND